MGLDLKKVANSLTKLFKTVMSLKISRTIDMPGVSREYVYFDPMKAAQLDAKAAEMSQLLLEYIRADLTDGIADSCERLKAFMTNEMARIAKG